jgi:hypothetical protein
MNTLPTDYSHAQLVDALMSQYHSFIADGFEEDLELTVPEYKSYLEGLTHSQLIEETDCDDEVLFLSDFMYAWT